MAIEKNNLTPEQEREVERLLRTANLFRMRGQLIEAEGKCREILALVPNDVNTRQMLSDILLDCGKLDQAMVEIRTSMASDPGNPLIEKKYAKLTLALADREREKLLARDMIENPHLYHKQARNPGRALLISMIPGLGQVYNGDMAKACIIWGAFLVHILSWVIFQHPYPRWAMISIAGMIQFTDPYVIITGIMFFIAYMYGIIDATAVANKTAKATNKVSDI